VLRSELSSELGRGLVQRGDGDPHAGERAACCCDATGASEGNERLAVGARGGKQGVTGRVGGFNIIDSVLVVAVVSIEKTD